MEPRIVSLLPSATEIVCALGLGRRLVGRSHECDHPPEVIRLPPLTTTGLDRGRDSATIDRQVRDIVESGLSVYRVDGDRLRALAPDAIVTQTQCEVCAVTEDELAAAVGDWLDREPRLVSQRAASLSGLWDDVRRFGAALERRREAAALVSELQGRMAAIARDASHGPVRTRRVACIEWLEPLMAAGNWVPELVALAGGEDPFGRAGAHAPGLDFDDLVAADPDVIVLMPCGFDIARTGREMHLLTTRPRWSGIKAVREGRVYLTDGNAYFNRPGPRLVDSLAILARLIGADVPDEGPGWRRYVETSIE